MTTQPANPTPPTPALATAGIHHVTSIAKDPDRNVDFYTRVLALRLVKVTVNFDDPGSYHLYYGDDLGRPGTIMTFFPWPQAARGRRGTGEVAVTGFRVPGDSIPFWQDRLARLGVKAAAPITRFPGTPHEEQVLSFEDHDGSNLELVAPQGPGPSAPEGSADPATDVPRRHAITGFFGVTLLVHRLDGTARVLESVLGMRRVADAVDSDARPRTRFIARGTDGAPAPAPADQGVVVDVVVAPAGTDRAHLGAGSVHHVAFRAADDEQQEAFARALNTINIAATPQRERCYFRSIYFREPGAVLFEIATDAPGFTADQPAHELGTRLMLPPWFEHARDRIERALPLLHYPAPRTPPTVPSAS